VSESDDVALTDLMKRLEQENQEVSGDEESDLDEAEDEAEAEAETNGIEEK
jgi:hypothetical protein